MMKYDGPIQRFVCEGLQSDVRTQAKKYARLTSRMPQDFYDILSPEQRMDQLPPELLTMFAQEIIDLTGDVNSDSEELVIAIEGLLVEYDELWLNDKCSAELFREKQLNYFQQQAPIVKMIVKRLHPLIKRALFTDKIDSQLYSVMFRKNLSINYLPAGCKNKLGRSFLTISQGPMTISSFQIDTINDEKLSEILSQVIEFLEDSDESIFYFKDMSSGEITYMRGNFSFKVKVGEV